MRKFINCMLFSLLAVGWTFAAQAQALPSNKASINATLEKIGQPGTIGKNSNEMNQGQQFRAPLRSQNYSVTSPTVHPKSWYQALPDVTWDGGSQNITEPFTDVNGMMALVERVYTDKYLPGFKYSAPLQRDIEYPTIDFGWDIKGHNYKPITITTRNYDTYISYIAIRDTSENIIVSWSAGTNGTTLPTGWTCNTTMRTYSYSNTSCVYLGTSTTGGTITIDPSSFINYDNDGVVELVVRYAAEAATTINVNGDDEDVTTSWKGTYWIIPANVDEPIDAGYTVLLVKLHDNFDNSNVPEYTYSRDQLRNYFQTYIKEIQLLTDGLRVNEGQDNAGTLFAYSGDVNRFYFIGKGKMVGMSSLYVDPFDRAPFYSMYEEFSPYVSGGSEDHSDLYERMRHMETYPVIHDCEGVIMLNHYFSMTGAEGDSENRVNSLVFYIPDYRGETGGWQTYDPQHQPTVGMYIIDLSADIEPAAQTDYYTVTVSWVDDLDVITHSEGIDQTYRLYEIRYNEETGQNDTTLVYTGPNTSWNFDYPVEDSYYDLHYFVIGTPTDATNHETFYAKSNTDNVTIPGKKDFLGLQWWRYESDYVTTDGENTEVNYYRNFIAPHALSVLGHAGINAENVGTEGRTLTLYRKYGNTEIPIFDLELIMDGNRAYYRIKHINREANQQVEPGYDENTGERKTTNN